MSSSVLKLSSKEPITSSCFLKDQQSIKCLSLKSGTGFIPLLADKPIVREIRILGHCILVLDLDKSYVSHIDLTL